MIARPMSHPDSNRPAPMLNNGTAFLTLTVLRQNGRGDGAELAPQIVNASNLVNVQPPGIDRPMWADAAGAVCTVTMPRSEPQRLYVAETLPTIHAALVAIGKARG